MKKAELQSKIDKLEKGIASKATPKNLVASLKAQKEKFEKELAELNKTAKKPATKTPKPTLAKFKKDAKGKSAGLGLKRDSERKALPLGKRVSASGNEYWEGRENRTDSQTKKKPYLEDGGELSTYKNLEGINLSKLEVVETKAMGNPDKLILKDNGKKVAQFYYNIKGYNKDFSLKNKEGIAYHFGGDKSKLLQISNFKKAIKEGYTYIKFYDEFEKGGYMAKGGEVKVGDIYKDVRSGDKVEIVKVDEHSKEVTFKIKDSLYTISKFNVYGHLNNRIWVKNGGYMAKGGEAKEGYIQQVVEIATKAHENGLVASNMTYEEFEEKLAKKTDTIYAKEYIKGAYQAMKNKGYAKGGYMAKGGEAKSFDSSAFDELVGESVDHLWRGYNKLEQAINYLGRSGKSGEVNSFKQKVGFERLEDAINNVDMANSKFANGGELHRNEQ